jgi:hypothetical protein
MKLQSVEAVARALTAEAFADPAQRSQWMTEKGMTVLNFHSDEHRETPVDVFASEPFDFDEEYGKALVEEIARRLGRRVRDGTGPKRGGAE